MTPTEDLESALRDAMVAHTKWRLRLKTAISSRTSDITPQHAACDDQCDFGKWLYGPDLDDDIRNSPPYKVVRRLHAEFHKVASESLEGALNGQKRWNDKTALQEFDTSSAQLNKALSKWLSELRHA